MKTSLLLSAIALASHTSAFFGQMAASAYFSIGGTQYQIIDLRDYNTGSTYSGLLVGGFNGCTTTECNTFFNETSPGGYSFDAKVWRTNDGCHNIDFEGALDAHHGYCCGSLPCNFSA